MRLESGNEQAAYWVNDEFESGPYIVSEGAGDWLPNPAFRQATNVFESPDVGNYIRLTMPRLDPMATRPHPSPVNSIPGRSIMSWSAMVRIKLSAIACTCSWRRRCLRADGTRWLQVSGNAMVPPIDWDPFENIPIKLFGDQSYGGPNSTVFMSFLTQDDASATYDLFLNPPLDALPDTRTASGTVDFLVTFNAVGVNAGEWAGPKGNHNVPYTSPGPLAHEFRFGETYASVAPIAVPTLDIAIVETNVRISWSPELPGFALQMSESLEDSNWTAAPVGNPVLIPVDTATRFFRLSGE